MAAEETTTEQWFYTGKRLDAKDKLFDTWYDPARDRTYNFTKLTAMVPGQAYAIEVVRNGDDRMSVRGTPRYLAEQATITATDAQVTEWRALHKAAQQVIENKRTEKQARDDDELEAALEVLRRHHKKLTTQARRGAFISYVIGETTRAPKQRREEEQ